jgi:thiol-disulfide isomerase/thioredoxin
MSRLKASHGPSLKQRLLALAGLVAIVGVAVVVLIAADLLGSQGGGEGIEDVRVLEPLPVAGADLEVGPQVGHLAPDFEISDFDGARHRLSDFRGKVVYVNFWATWCLPCAVELPDMQVLKERHADELVIIAVNRGEPVERARSYFNNLERHDGGRGVSFTVNALDPNDTLYREYRALGMPASFFISPDGVVTDVFNGLIRLETMEEAVAKALSTNVSSIVGEGGS